MICFQLCSVHYTVLQMNSLRSTSVINLATMENRKIHTGEATIHYHKSTPSAVSKEK